MSLLSFCSGHMLTANCRPGPVACSQEDHSPGDRAGPAPVKCRAQPVFMGYPTSTVDLGRGAGAGPGFREDHPCVG